VPDGRGDQAAAHVSDGQRGGQQGVRVRALGGLGPVGDHRLTRWFVKLEGEAEQNHADRRHGKVGCGCDAELRRRASGQADQDGTAPAQPVREPPAEQPARDRRQAKQR